MKISWKSGLCYLILFAFCFMGGRMTAQRQAVRAANMTPSGKLAIVIDDFGYNGNGTDKMLALPIPFTAAVMPFSEYSGENAKKAVAAGKEVIIHMPMESTMGKREWVGDKGIFLDMTDDEIKAVVEEAYAILPEAVGMNNHMGSAITESARCLGDVLDIVKEKNGFFIDSVTTCNSVAKDLTAEKGIPFFKRSVFLDGTNDVETVKKNLRKAAAIALKEGKALAIGHVGPEGGDVTERAIEELIPELEKQGITFVTAGDLVE
ncbi:divergent polysaccharide deacetylase family protein [Anaerotignum sp.]|uniref:divergent polysaccharide deacetylase family protein n=1 Tax=Anaerotignum sp. TaxID=2039241 RepID=UPI0028964658|nr:divergent polysaccharide deacetylase family protein [Anaerotignum sp.]